LAVGVAAAVLQILFGAVRAGILGEFFPISAVHGMLAAIGVIIIAKQVPVALGVSAAGDPLTMLARIPTYVAEANPAIAAIGITSVLIMFLWPLVGRRSRLAKMIPSPVIVLLVAVPMGMYLDLLQEHSYTLQKHRYQLHETFLVAIDPKPLGLFDQIATPDFSVLTQTKAWGWVLMFFIIGSLESLLSAKAVDLIDPWKRKSSMDRDVVAIGVGNLCSAMVGGLPMISEIVRSRANIDNGARTRFADLWHGIFLLACVAFIPMILHRIPMAALAAMLIYTGFRLAHPREFMNVWRIGREQLVIFCTTLVAVLATDLLWGIVIGIAAKFIIHLANGVPLRSMFWSAVEVVDDDGSTVRLECRGSAVFSNWIMIRRRIEQLGLVPNKNVILDLTNTKLIDHSVMDKLHEMESDFTRKGLTFSVEGLDTHPPLADHEYAARRKGLWTVQRLTIYAPIDLERLLISKIVETGASGYTSMHCTGAGRHQLQDQASEPAPQIRIEVIAPLEICQQLMEYMRRDIQPHQHLTFCLEAVKVARIDGFQAINPLDEADKQLMKT
jgi:MFS superfamily sulfate permease-like transporter